MALGDRYLKNAAKAAESTVGEQVVSVGFASRSGSLGSVIAGQALKLGELAAMGDTVPGMMTPRGSIERAHGDNTRLPMNFLLAITPSAVHVFKHKMFWGRIKIKSELGTFPLTDFEFACEDRRLTKQFLICSPTAGEIMTFEMTKGKHAGGFETALGEATRSR